MAKNDFHGVLDLPRRRTKAKPMEDEKRNRYSIHIQFHDGSNPYVRYSMTEPEFFQEKKKWEANFRLEYIPNLPSESMSIVNYMAYAKGGR